VDQQQALFLLLILVILVGVWDFGCVVYFNIILLFFHYQLLRVAKTLPALDLFHIPSKTRNSRITGKTLTKMVPRYLTDLGNDF
jgi:hypothetical protein